MQFQIRTLLTAIASIAVAMALTVGESWIIQGLAFLGTAGIWAALALAFAGMSDPQLSPRQNLLRLLPACLLGVAAVLILTLAIGMGWGG